ncbi:MULTISPECIES: DUF1488 domain-containing protein [Pantoea]|jgi:hypothetical protein|uniref:DUF1488 domain-containing protein n=1 Tax=Pantoea anthophila TaxID=470931 RepID=A0ABY2Z2I0_9GAMM|nr:MULTISPECIES: DUF1488 domain-containing protein [Pantoea]KAF6652963.1 DUF1488 domain-containing protein [Enterobacteriaceae bacterium EKM102V]TPE10176.1 DUF1488 domain-containing protein [Pantoea vagans]EIB97269.1 hypothetical protein S7A_02110 [Pantoea sp. Sc1]KAA5965488.1 DUF1488 domain-containing protein [Pantoea sp. M_6]KAA5970488.1 DUF1488 domain-containing protein [Pantoea sp. M_8]
MNQAIQFPDDETYDAERDAVCFPVLVNGMRLICAISRMSLTSRFGEGEAMALFQHHRWDLEDEAEAAIRQERVDAQGWVWLSPAR